MHQPSPDPSGASHGDHTQPEATHLACACQAGRHEPVAFCGTTVDRLTDHDPDPVVWCVVCWDLARTAVVARRCERCT